MVLVTTSVRSGRVSRFPLVRCIARAVCRQPQPVGLWSAWRMRNKLRKICTHHRLEDRLRGTTRTNHRGYHTPIRTTEQSLADSPRCTLSGSREGESLPGGAQRSPPTTSITSQITTVEILYLPAISTVISHEKRTPVGSLSAAGALVGQLRVETDVQQCYGYGPRRACRSSRATSYQSVGGTRRARAIRERTDLLKELPTCTTRILDERHAGSTEATAGEEKHIGVRIEVSDQDISSSRTGRKENVCLIRQSTDPEQDPVSLGMGSRRGRCFLSP